MEKQGGQQGEDKNREGQCGRGSGGRKGKEGGDKGEADRKGWKKARGPN